MTEPETSAPPSKPKPKPSRARVIVDWVVGVTLIIAGIIMGFIPILQGWVSILAGLAVLSSHSKWARAIFERIKGAGRNVREKMHTRRAERRDRDR